MELAGRDPVRGFFRRILKSKLMRIRGRPVKLRNRTFGTLSGIHFGIRNA
jgi:hypothetical protein